MHETYKAVFPAVSIGSNIVETVATINNAADTKIGPSTVAADVLPLIGVVEILMRGAIKPPIRFSAGQSASPVPRWGAGKASGVYAYNTPYI